MKGIEALAHVANPRWLTLQLAPPPDAYTTAGPSRRRNFEMKNRPSPCEPVSSLEQNLAFASRERQEGKRGEHSKLWWRVQCGVDEAPCRSISSVRRFFGEQERERTRRLASARELPDLLSVRRALER